MRKCNYLLTVVVMVCLFHTVSYAQMRDFVGSNGRIIEAEFLGFDAATQVVKLGLLAKVSTQMKDENDDPILMLNVFVHTLKLHLASWSVHGEKTNEPSCLKKHLEELFTMYPCVGVRS